MNDYPERDPITDPTVDRIIRIRKQANGGIYGDTTVYKSYLQLCEALDDLIPGHRVKDAYSPKELSKARRIELLAKALVEAIKGATV